MIPISEFQSGAVMGFLTGAAITLVVCLIVYLYFQAKRRRRHRSFRIGGTN